MRLNTKINLNIAITALCSSIFAPFIAVGIASKEYIYLIALIPMGLIIFTGFKYFDKLLKERKTQYMEKL